MKALSVMSRMLNFALWESVHIPTSEAFVMSAGNSLRHCHSSCCSSEVAQHGSGIKLCKSFKTVEHRQFFHDYIVNAVFAWVFDSHARIFCKNLLLELINLPCVFFFSLLVAVGPLHARCAVPGVFQRHPCCFSTVSLFFSGASGKCLRYKGSFHVLCTIRYS